MENNKKNDLFENMLVNPSFTLFDFENVGLTAENTSIKDKKDYMKSENIIQAFTNSEGVFDDKKFNSYYNTAVKAYDAFAKSAYEKKFISNVEYDVNNIYAPQDSKIKQLDFSIEKIQNPDRLKIGVNTISGTSERTKSHQELAQSQKVWDSENEKWLDWTPEDRGLNIFSYPDVVMAKWREDGEHKDPITGRTVRHRAGDRRLNNEGTYFAETIGSRSPYGEEFISYADTLTKEDSFFNKYDFFDSDDLEKSITGTIFKTAAVVAPIFVPYVGEMYLAAGIAKELGKVLPVLYKSSFGLLNEDDSALNKMESFAYSLDMGVSEYSKENTFTFENIFGLLGDVGLQLAQQRWIFKRAPDLIKALQGESKFNEGYLMNLVGQVSQSKTPLTGEQITSAIRAKMAVDATRAQANLQNYSKTLSQLYMAGISGVDGFGSAIEAGYDREHAALVSWATLAGMYAIQANQVVENYMFPELAQERHMYRTVLNETAEKSRDAINTIAKTKLSEPAKKMKMFVTVRDIAKKFGEKINSGTLGVAGAAFVEGTEEVTEELLEDFVKGTTDFFGANDTRRFDTWGSGEETLSRYAMAFLGGTMGGAMNKVHMNFTTDKSTSEANRQEMIRLIASGYGDKLREEAKYGLDKGLLGSTELSASRYEKDSDGNEYFKSAESAEDTQNYAVYNTVVSYIDYLEGIINQENLDLNDNEILDAALMREVRYQDLSQSGIMNRIIQDFTTLSSDIVKNRTEINGLTSTLSDTGLKNAESDVEFQEKLAKLNAKKDALKEQYNAFIRGDKAEEYLKLTLYGLNKNLHNPLNILSFRSYVEWYYKKPYDSLSDDQKNSIKDEYNTYVKNEQADNLKMGFTVFDNFNKTYSPEILKIANSNEYQGARLAMKAVSDMKFPINLYYGSDIENNEEFKEYSRKLFDYVKEIIANEKQLIIDKDTFFDRDSEESRLMLDEIVDVRRNNEVIKYLKTIKLLGEKLSNNGFIDSKYYELISQPMNIFNKIHNMPDISSLMFGNSSLMSLYQAKNRDFYDLKSSIESVTLTKQNEQLPKLYDKINKLIENKEDATNLINSIQDHVNNFVNENVNIGGEEVLLRSELIPTLNEIENLGLKSTQNPLNTLLSKMSLSLTGKTFNIFDLLNDEKTRMSNIDRADDYIIENRERLDDIKQAKDVLLMVKSLLSASQTVDLDGLNPYGYNQSINSFRERHNLQGENLGTIDAETTRIFLDYIESLEMRVDYLYRLSELNKANQLVEHKKTAVNIRTLIFDIFSGKKHKWLQASPLLEGIDSLINNSPTLKELSENRNTVVTDDIYTKVEKEITLIEDKIYDNFQNIKTDDIEQTLYDLFVKDDNFNTENFRSGIDFNSTQDTFPESDLYVYLHSIISLKSSDFYYHYKELLEGDEFEYIPVFSQEYAAKLAISQLANPNIFTAALNNIKMEDLPKLYNLMFVEGITGSGKTSATGKLIYSLYKKLTDFEPNVWISGPYQRQVDNLGKIYSDVEKKFSKDELFNNILGEDVYSDFKSDLENGTENILTYGKKDEKNQWTDILFKDFEGIQFNKIDLPNIIFIDEITHYNTMELEILSEYAYQNNIQIVAFGDVEQNGSSGRYAPKTFNSSIPYGNIDNTIVISSPKLAISMRASNTQNLDNLNSVRAINSMFTRDLSEYLKVGTLTHFETIRENLLLKFHQDREGRVYGNKVVNSLTEKEIKLLASHSDEPLLYIYDNVESDTYKLINSIDPEGKLFTKVLMKDVQGSESKFAIIDLNWGKYTGISNQNDPKNLIKELYTAITRAEEGSFIIENGITVHMKAGNGYLGYVNLREEDNWTQTKFNASSGDVFKEFRNNTLLEIVGDYKSSEVLIYNEVEESDNTEESENDTQKEEDESEEEYTDDSETEEVEETDSEQQEEKKEIEEKKEEQKSSKTKKVKAKPKPITPILPIDKLESDDFNLNNKNAVQDLLAYGFYTRFGVKSDGINISLNENESHSDLNIFLDENDKLDRHDIEAKIKINSYFMLKSAILFSKTKEELSSKINNEFKTRFRKDLRDIKVEDGAFEIKYKKFENIDKTDEITKFGYDDVKSTPQSGFLPTVVYTVRNANGDIQLEMSMFVLPEVATIEKSLNSQISTKVKDSKKTLIKKYKDLLLSLDLEYKNTNKTVYRGIDPNWIPNMSRVRLVDIYNNGKAEKFTLTEMMDKSPGLIISQPYIVTGHNSEFDSNLNNAESKTFVFVTADRFIRSSTTGKLIDSTQLADEYRRSFNEDGTRNDHRISMIQVYTKGISFREYIENYNNAAINLGNVSKENQFFYSKNMGARIFSALWNERAKLLSKSDNLTDTEIDDIEIVNNILKDLEYLLPDLFAYGYVRTDSFSSLDELNYTLEQLNKYDTIYAADKTIKIDKALKMNEEYTIMNAIDKIFRHKFSIGRMLDKSETESKLSNIDGVQLNTYITRVDDILSRSGFFPYGITFKPMFENKSKGRKVSKFVYPATQNQTDNYILTKALEFPRAFLPVDSISLLSKTSSEIINDNNIKINTEFIEDLSKNKLNDIKSDSVLNNIKSTIREIPLSLDNNEFIKTLNRLLNDRSNKYKTLGYFFNENNNSDSEIINNYNIIKTDDGYDFEYDNIKLKDVISNTFDSNTDINDIVIEFDENSRISGKYFLSLYPENVQYFKVESESFILDDKRANEIEPRDAEIKEQRNEELNNMKEKLISKINDFFSNPYYEKMDESRKIEEMTMNIVNSIETTPELYNDAITILTKIINDFSPEAQEFYEQFEILQDEVSSINNAEKNNNQVCKF